MKLRGTIGWIAILLNSLFACIWSYWGILENFHEGWYYESLGRNLGLMLGQYLLFALVYVVLGVISIRWNKLGSLVFVIASIAMPLKFNTLAAWVIFSFPMLITAVLYFFFPVQKKRWAQFFVIGIPVAIIMGFAIEPVSRISRRPHFDHPESITLAGNNVELTWAPEGPGWPGSTQELTYKSWHDVVYICAHLSEDGKTLTDQELNFWRLPTAKEVAHSLMRHGKNAGGVWDEIEKKSNIPNKARQRVSSLESA